MLESLHWQNLKGSNCIQFLCEVYYSDYQYFLEYEMMGSWSYDDGWPNDRLIVVLDVRGPGICWIYDYGDDDEDYFMDFLGLKED